MVRLLQLQWLTGSLEWFLRWSSCHPRQRQGSATDSTGVLRNSERASLAPDQSGEARLIAAVACVHLHYRTLLGARHAKRGATILHCLLRSLEALVRLPHVMSVPVERQSTAREDPDSVF
jgi:hypothetical protein